MIDAEAKRIDRSSGRTSTSLKPSDKSLMPEGFEKQLKEPEIVDLLEFLTHKGKYLPLPLDKVATVVSTRGMFFGARSRRPSGWSSPTGSRRRSTACRSYLVDPQRRQDGERGAAATAPTGKIPPTMPKSVSLPVQHRRPRRSTSSAGVSRLGLAARAKGYRQSLIVRLHYKDGKSEDHELKNGEHIRRLHPSRGRARLEVRLRPGRTSRYAT